MKKNRGQSPERTCAVCGAKGPKGGFMRYVLEGEELSPDERQIKHGRGAYVCTNDKCGDTGKNIARLYRSLRKTERRNRKTG